MVLRLPAARPIRPAYNSRPADKDTTRGERPEYVFHAFHRSVYDGESPKSILRAGASGRQLRTWARAMRVRDSSVCHSLTQNVRVSPSMTKIESLWTIGAGSTQPPSSSASKSSGKY